ncbi:MAG: VIT1/CCC1 transporter family protein [Patescibacteria group bacterium]
MEIIDKITGIIFGLFGSIIASFGVALMASFLTDDPLTIVFAGLIVAIASSIANAFGPLTCSSNIVNDKAYSKEDVEQSCGSLFLTFFIVVLPLIPYLLVSELELARMISIMTGLILLFIFGAQHAQLRQYSPLLYGFMMVAIGIICAYLCVYVSHFFI